MENQKKQGVQGTDGEINDSPIEQVRLTVPITDDPTLPTLTFRTWVLGPITCIMLAFSTQFFSYRQNRIIIPAGCFQTLLVIFGKLMAAKLPSRPVKVAGTKWAFSMNPGPFNIKEHVLITILATSGLDASFGLALVSILKGFYHKKLNFFGALLMTQTTQMMGYGFAGIFMQFLVNSPYMWYPFALIDVSFYRALHEVELRPKEGLTRLQFFLIVTVSCFAYSMVPGYFFPSISALSVICLFWKKSVIAQLIGSGRHGLGIGSFALDWSAVSILGNPLGYPIQTITNMMIGVVLVLCIVSPIAYWANLYNARRFAFSSYNLFDYSGQDYNVSRILNETDLTLNQEKYESYSQIYFSVLYLYTTGFDFASITATLVHFLLFHGREVWQQFKQAHETSEHASDVHNRLMKRYNPIPRWWFLVILVSMVGLAIFTCEGFGKQFQLPYWGILLACLLVIILLLPLAVLQATTGQSMDFGSVSEILFGYLSPGKPVASLAFKSYSLSTMLHALQFIYELKLAHYMKIPPKAMFAAQVTGTLLSSLTSCCTTWWLLSTIENICDPERLPKGSPWTCPGQHAVYSDTIIWGVIGPSRIFFPHGLYSNLYYFFLIGALAPLLVWALSRFFPEKKWIRNINIPNILGSCGGVLIFGIANYWGFFAMGLIFNFFVYKRYIEWWIKYNYVLAYGLDVGVAFQALLGSLTLQLKGIYGVNWWGLDVTDHCPLATCPTAPGVTVKGCPSF